MNPFILTSEVQSFIRSYAEDLTRLALKGSPFPEISIQELLQQIEGFRKTKTKLPSWHQKEGIIYPPKINIEQTSSEITGKYKASLVTGQSLADITGGLGVDCYYFAETCSSVFHFEQNIELSAIAGHNFSLLQKTNIHCRPIDGISSIKDQHYDVLYVDPARRNESKGKVFFLKDCEPNIVAHWSYLLDRCDTLLVKTSPMLDIAAGLKELNEVAEIHIVAVDNEVKELLWLINGKATASLIIKTVNFSKHGKEEFSFEYANENVVNYSLPLDYLYEPNAAIMKSGGFSEISSQFNLGKLHPHSHLYTTNTLTPFPGRRFSVSTVIPYTKKEIKKALQHQKANVTTRNFPESVNALRKKWNIQDGGDVYLFFTTDLNNDKIVLVCNKLPE